MKALTVTCDTKLKIPLDELIELQGNFKEMTKARYEKFKKLILKRGIWFASHVWKELTIENGVSLVKWWIIDGHGRKRLLTKMRAEGYAIPDIPCVEISAASLKEAKEAVLAASSNFQRATKDGLYEFISGASISFDELDAFEIPDIDLPDFKDEFGPDASKERVEFDAEIGQAQFLVIVNCADEGAQRELFEKLSGEGWTCKITG